MGDIDITRGSRHNKIIGHFGESLICNWLSRSGFEVVVVDHTGLDIMAYDPKTRRRLGIYVKSRTRTKERERSSVNIFSNREKDNDRKKLIDACRAFRCEPWMGIYVETTDHGDLYLVSLKRYDKKYRGSAKRTLDTWKMAPQYQFQYEQDPQVKHIRIEFPRYSWNWANRRRRAR